MMPQILSILYGAAFTVVISAAAGGLLLRWLGLKFPRGESLLLGFVLGSACLSSLVFVLAAYGLARLWVFQICGFAILGILGALRPWRPAGAAAELHSGADARLPIYWRVLLYAGFCGFAALYFLNAIGPEWSQSGATGSLVLVARYARDHGLSRLPNNLLGGFPQGLEMLYLFAYSVGKHPAAALVHCAYLLALPLLILAYARRAGFIGVGVFGALLTFASPVVGIDGSTASKAVALAAILFSLFHLLQIWDRERRAALLVPIGLLAGFAGAVAYRGFLGVAFALGFVGYRLLRARQSATRALAIVCACAALTGAPWIVRTWMVTGDPVSPFLSGVFSSPTVNQPVVKEYLREAMDYPAVESIFEILWEATVRGETLGGLIGPVFLLAPLALLALRKREGKQLLLAAAVFAIPFAADIGTRSLIPSLPFLALSLGLAFEGPVLFLAPVLLFAHLVLSYPAVAAKYCSWGAPRIKSVSTSVALHIRPDSQVLSGRLSDYALIAQLDSLTAPGSKVFSMRPVPEAYTSREVLVWNRGALNLRLMDGLRTAMTPEARPTLQKRFRFPAARLRAVRVVQWATGPGEWIVHEVRLFLQERELPRAFQWKLRASSNPWDVQLAFDNSPVTFWRSIEDLRPDMSLEVELDRAVELDSVVLETSPAQTSARLSLEGLADGDVWKAVAESSEDTDVIRPTGLRRMAIREFKAQGIEYILVADSDFFARDFRDKPDLWGVTELAQVKDLRLYKLR
jgi:hypothetical protein